MNRTEKIQSILDDLQTLLEKSPAEDEDIKFAIRENIRFIRALKSYPKYIFWLVTQAPFLRKEKLLELTDLAVEKWEEELHYILIQNAKKSPHMLGPLIDAAADYIIKNRPKIIIDFGSGGMEAELQILKKIIKNGYSDKIVFIGIDRSEIANKMAEENLREISAQTDIHKIENIDQRALEDILQKSSKPVVILSKNDIFKLENDFGEKSIDLIFYSKFIHHLNEEQKRIIKNITNKLAKITMEYDNYRDWFFLLTQPWRIWSNPILLNGAIFSRLRGRTKKELIKVSKNEGAEIKFFKIDSYLKVYKR